MPVLLFVSNHYVIYGSLAILCYRLMTNTVGDILVQYLNGIDLSMMFRFHIRCKVVTKKLKLVGLVCQYYFVVIITGMMRVLALITGREKWGRICVGFLPEPKSANRAIEFKHLDRWANLALFHSFVLGRNNLRRTSKTKQQNSLLLLVPKAVPFLLWCSVFLFLSVPNDQ